MNTRLGHFCETQQLHPSLGSVLRSALGTLGFACVQQSGAREGSHTGRSAED